MFPEITSETLTLIDEEKLIKELANLIIKSCGSKIYFSSSFDTRFKIISILSLISDFFPYFKMYSNSLKSDSSINICFLSFSSISS